MPTATSNSVSPGSRRWRGLRTSAQLLSTPPPRPSSNVALAAGARGVLSKSMHADELAEAVLSVAGGLQVVSDKVPNREAEEPPALGYKFGLTSRESEVAALLARGLSNKALAPMDRVTRGVATPTK
jgi:DNA-binding NarL/FixJ family response regulator